MYSDADIEMAELASAARRAEAAEGRPYDPARDEADLYQVIRNAVYGYGSVFEAVTVYCEDYGIDRMSIGAAEFDLAERAKRGG